MDTDPYNLFQLLFLGDWYCTVFTPQLIERLLSLQQKTESCRLIRSSSVYALAYTKLPNTNR